MKAKTFQMLCLVYTVTALASLSAWSKSPAPKVREETVRYKAGDIKAVGFVAYDENRKGKLPVVLVVHEWWGLNDYPKMRARMLAELGYFAMAVDLYGDGKIAASPAEAQQLAGRFYQNPSLVKINMDAAVEKIREFPRADPGNMAAIGYCFGGFSVLNYAKLGAPLKGVVSFHGGLGGVVPDKGLLKARLLICHGGSDKFVSMSDVELFKHRMDSIGANYTVKVYPNATHAFSNPESTANGKRFNMPIEYNAAADKNSWNDMKVFLERIFGK
jgi:dienelactone hydrolase